MKKLLPFILAVTILSGCAANENTDITEAGDTVTTGETKKETTTAAAVSETTAVTEKEPPANADLDVNADGTLNDTFTERINSLFDHTTGNSSLGIGVYPSLWDFSDDGVPEIILTYHTGKEGYMPCRVYDPKSLKQIGEFDGFCRDGFTRFVNGYDVGTVIYSYYEQSDRQRDETVEFVHIENGRLARKKKIYHHWRGQVMQLQYESFARASSGEKDFLDYNFGTVCTSYGVDIDSSERAAAAVESYNNYIKLYKITEEDYPVGCVFIGQKNEAAIYEISGEGFFKDENGEITPLNNDLPYFNIYKLWDDIIVCEPLGNTQPCDVYIMTDGKPVLDEKISGQGNACLLSRSKLYNGGFEMTESVYDASSFGSHTFKTYQLYRDEDGFHEYGSIVVPVEEFNKYYGESAPIYLNDGLAAMKGWGVDAGDLEIYEVLYRSDNCFILNCRSPIIIEDTGYENGYNFFNITLKTSENGKLTEACRDRGVYKTALIPEIAVYPEKMYIPAAEE